MNIQFLYLLTRRIATILVQNVMAINSRPMIISLAALLVALSSSAVVLAGHETGSVPSYTGCLNPGGTIYNAAPGETPSKPCITDHPTIHLSGGDITAVIAGTGLSGGGSEGVISLSVDSTQVQTRISGNCDFPGGAISKIDETGQVNCSSGPAVFFLSDDGTQDVSDGGEVVGSLSLPPGQYLINSKIDFDIKPASVFENFWEISCHLIVQPGNMAIDHSSAGGDTDLGAGSTLIMITAVDLQDPGSAEVSCRDFGDLAGNADFSWTWLKISAIQLGASQVTEIP